MKQLLSRPIVFGIAVFAALASISIAPSRADSAVNPPAAHGKSAAHSAAGDQSAVALKTPPATISASDPKVKAALTCKDIAKATALAGKTACMQGTVDNVYSPGSHEFAIVDFDEDYDNTITAFVKSEDFAKLPDLAKLNGKKVLICAPVSMYRNKPEFDLTDAKQIMLIK
jgi:hypothetical protein